MVRPAHTLITFEGTIGPTDGAVEDWSVGLRCTGGVTANGGSLTAAASAASAAFAGTLLEQMGNNLRLTEVTVASVTGNGTWATDTDGAYLKGDWTGNLVGGNSTSSPLPAQAALVISLTTARAGATGKGRLFLPLGRATVGLDGRIPAENAAAFAGIAADFISDMNAIVGQVAVVSTKGYASTVTGVRVGRTVDTMRSRRSDIAEQYALASIP